MSFYKSTKRASEDAAGATAHATAEGGKAASVAGLYAWRLGISVYIPVLAWLLKDLKWPWSTQELLGIAAMVVGHCATSYLVRVSFRPFVRPLLKRKAAWSQEIVEVRLSAMCGNIFKLGYHVVASVVIYMLVKDTDWLPRELLGSGTLRDEAVGSHLFANKGVDGVGRPVSDGVNMYYHFALAYHLQEMLVLIFIEGNKPSFYEMLLHHCTTLFLIVWSYAITYRRVGVLVLIIHYVSDVPGYVCKVFVDTSLKVITVSGYLSLLFWWGYLRLYVLPFVVLYETTNKNFVESLGYNTSFYLLGLLVVMHAYWYALFLHMGYVLVCTGETKDTQARLPSQAVLKADKKGKKV
jgi:hypothetical protein